MSTVQSISSFQAMLRLTLFLATLVVAFFASTTRANQENFLDPEKAFILQAEMADASHVRLRFNIANGYYMYREQFAFKLDTDVVKLGEAKFPVGKVKHDPTFDRQMELFFKEAVITLPISAWPDGVQQSPFLLTITGQGCAEAGICYPPMDFIVKMQATPQTIGYLVEST